MLLGLSVVPVVAGEQPLVEGGAGRAQEGEGLARRAAHVEHLVSSSQL